MPGPATLIAQALNGTGRASSYGGYNPFPGANPSSYQNPGASAATEVQQGQSLYSGQQAFAKSQLQASIAPSSIGGQIQSNGADLATHANPGAIGATPGGGNSFGDQLASINQRGIDATNQVKQQQALDFAKKISDLNSQYSTNQASLGNSLGQLNYVTGADPNTNAGARAVAIAKQSLGVNYVYGGNSLTAGVDCSGLVQQVYARLGIRLPRTSTEQARFGKVVPSIQQALPGDLILMYSPYEPAGLQQFGHVGIYIGNGMMIDAPHTGAKVRIERISNMTRIVRPW